MENIEGAKLIGSTWHCYKRVPKRLVEALDLGSMFKNYKNGFIRGSMKTKDPDKARILARDMLNRLDKLEAKLDSVAGRVENFWGLSPKEQVRLRADIAKNVSALPPDQRQLIQKTGGVSMALDAMDDHEVSAAFMSVGLGAGYRVKDDIGEPYDPDEREIEEAADASFLALQEKKGKVLRDALSAAEVIEPAADAVSGLRGLLEDYCEDRGYQHTAESKDQTRQQYEYAVRRFVEYHGDLPLPDLRKKHLADFARDFLKLPVSSRKDVRPLAFWDAVKIAEAEDLPRVSPRTRNQNLTLLKSLMKYAVGEDKRDGPDPWAGYTPTVGRQKVSTSRQKKKHVFSRDEVRRIVTHIKKTRDPNTVDYWGALFGAFHGLRIEEVSQLRVADVTTTEGFLCVTVTDEDDRQKVKNANTFRTIPIHAGLVDRGFKGYVERRRKAGGDMLFMEAARWGGDLHEIEPEGRGRYGNAYGKRFKGELERLKIEGYKVGYHSFRHAWTDLARNAGINPEHRRALAGRDSEEDRDAPKVDPTENRYGHGFSIKVLADSLKKLKPLD